MSLRDVRGFMEMLSQDYTGISYNLITRNCNHFCNDACLQLTGNPIPNWINRLARIGFLCNCIVPASINLTKVGIEDHKVCNEAEIKTKLRSRSNRFTSSSSSLLSSSVDRPRSHARIVLPSSSLLMLDSPSSQEWLEEDVKDLDILLEYV
ncbi:uncharacterized protein LOC128129157 [Lactuca sativa]|uniref:uncharacterized protein LOC128129157 n=1 Tax=Lactuca sativa TaxID=4236 RepID=UPI0022AE9149|nr:uncharacterized protein LOC128129157 [Lactuca sativa]